MWKKWKQTDFIFLGSKITVNGDCSHRIKRHLPLGRKAMTNLDSVFKSRYHFAEKSLFSQSYGFSSSHVQMWELDHKEGWAPKNWWFWTVVLEKILENPLDCKELKPVNPKGNQLWIFIERSVAEPPILGHLMQRTDSLEKTQMLGKTEGGRRRWWQQMIWLDGITDPMDCSTPGFPVHHQLPEFTQTHVHWVGDTIQASHPSPPALSLSQHQGHFQWVSSSNQVAKVSGLQL